MGEVWKAKDTRLDRFVAVKVLPEHLAKHPESLARFEREAKAVAALNHPNIMGIFDMGRVDETAYAVMELLEGESLRARLEQGSMPVRKATELAIQLAQGLAVAHEKGVIHRDLKPDNLWITKEGRLKILDFGLAKQMPAMGVGSDSFVPTAAQSRPSHREGHDPRDPGLHESRAGARWGRGCPSRHLQLRGRAFRDAHGQARFRPGHRQRHHGGHPEG
jgi:serine/threonine protein kinase